MYDADYFFVDNPLNRYTLSPRNKLKANADGSVDLYIQHESPGKDKESNWLPAPKDKFILMMRLYWPKEKPPSILDGTLEDSGGEGGVVVEKPARSAAIAAERCRWRRLGGLLTARSRLVARGTEAAESRRLK